ncbi:MAG: putative PEP-binding protein [Nocardioides sp.]
MALQRRRRPRPCRAARAAHRRHQPVQRGHARHELRRLDEALGSLRLSIDDMLSRREVAFEGEHRAVLEAYRMFAHDRGWVRRLEEAIRNGLTAEAAVEKVQSDTRARMLHMTDPYLRERLRDFDDLANRLLRAADGARAGDAGRQPAEGRDHRRALDGRGGAAGLSARQAARPGAGGRRRHQPCRDRGARHGHPGRRPGRRAPCPCRKTATRSSSTARTARVHLRPQPDLEAAYAEKVRFRARRQELYRELRDQPSVSQGRRARSTCMMNAGLAVDLPQLAESGAAGIGLFRTELQFMVAATFPRAEAQEQLYRDVLDAAQRQAGDLPHARHRRRQGAALFPRARSEENPALGWRAIRLTLDRPGLLRTQVRALLKAAGGRELRVMLPMVTEVSRDSRGARADRPRSAAICRRFGHQLPTSLKVGAMLEVPALLLAARRADGGGGLRLGRLERPVPVRHGDRPRQCAASPTGSIRCRRRSCAC